MTLYKSHTYLNLLSSSLKRLPAMRRPGFDHWVRKIPWRRKWQPTPAFLPGESHGQRGLVGYSPRSWTRLSNFTFTFFFSMYFCPFVVLYVEFFFNISKVTYILHFCTLIYLLQLLPPHDFQQTGSFILEICFIKT